MAHGGTNFGFYSGANTGANESEYKPDLTSYDYVRKKWHSFVTSCKHSPLIKLTSFSPRMHQLESPVMSTMQSSEVYY